MSDYDFVINCLPCLENGTEHFLPRGNTDKLDRKNDNNLAEGYSEPLIAYFSSIPLVDGFIREP